MIVIALGANLPGPAGTPIASLRSACLHLSQRHIVIDAASRLYRSAPVPPSGQPDFLNAALAISTQRTPAELLETLLEIEVELGRTRGQRWEARVLDLDLIDYNGQVIEGEGLDLTLPHPRLQDRRFVLAPLHDLNPGWRHPVSGLPVDKLLAELGSEQVCEAILDNWLEP